MNAYFKEHIFQCKLLRNSPTNSVGWKLNIISFSECSLFKASWETVKIFDFYFLKYWDFTFFIGIKNYFLIFLLSWKKMLSDRALSNALYIYTTILTFKKKRNSKKDKRKAGNRRCIAHEDYSTVICE